MMKPHKGKRLGKKNRRSNQEPKKAVEEAVQHKRAFEQLLNDALFGVKKK